MKFFVDPKLYPDAEGVARRAAARFQHRFGIGTDVLNERFPRVEREAIVAFLRGPADVPPQPVTERQMADVAAPAPSSLEQGGLAARSMPAATQLERDRLDEPANDPFDVDADSFDEAFEVKPDDVVMVATLGVEGVVVAVKETTATVALDGVTDEFDIGDLAPVREQSLEQDFAADGPASSVEPRVAPESPSDAPQAPPSSEDGTNPTDAAPPSSGKALEPPPSVEV